MTLSDRNIHVFFNFCVCACDRWDHLRHGAQGRGLPGLVIRVVLCFPEVLNRLPLIVHWPELVMGIKEAGF